MYLLLLLVIATCVFLFYQQPELFTNYVFITDKIKQRIVCTKEQYDNGVMKGLVPKLEGKVVLAYDAVPDVSDIVLDDIVGFMELHNSQKRIVAITNDTTTAFFLRDPLTIDSGHITDLADDSLIGFRNTKDLAVIQSLFYCFNIPFKKGRFVRFESLEEGAKALLDIKSIKSFFVMQNTEHSILQKTFNDKKIALYHFDDVDINILRFSMPHCLIQNYNMTNVFNRYSDKTRIRMAVGFPNILYSQTDKYNYLLDYIALYFQNNFDFINYFERFYEIHPRTKELYKKEATEGFVSDAPLKYEFDKPFDDIFYDAEHNILTLTIPSELVTLQKNDTVILSNQKHNIENGTYTVVRIDAYHRIATLTKTIEKMPFMENDPRYICTTNPSIKIKGLCENAYDTNGQKKVSADIWDKPCQQDTECPFFQKNKNYLNYRGGCNNGFCEMPLGISRQGFRYYKGEPLCHGCGTDKCCDKQDLPDYAFPLDEYDRQGSYVREHFTANECPAKTFQADFVLGDPLQAKNTTFFYEKDNTQIETLLRSSLMGKSFFANANANANAKEPIDFPKFLEESINNSIPIQETPFAVYDVVVQNKTINTALSATLYDVSCVLHRNEKSFGKVVFFQIYQNSKNGDLKYNSITVKGVKAQGDIKGSVGYVGADNKGNYAATELIPITSSDPIFVPGVAKRFICDRAYFLKQDRNLDAPCPSTIQL